MKRILERKGRGWDRGVKFEEALEKILFYRELARGSGNKRLLRNMDILLVLLMNGLRVSEAVECYYRFLETGERELAVKAAKSRGRYRHCEIPDVIDSEDVQLTRDLPRPKPETLTMASLNWLGFNTHSLRYALISRLLEENVDVATVARIVGHARPDALLAYVRERRVREVLRETMREAVRRVEKRRQNAETRPLS